jgi:uncharacterized protein YggE
MLRFGFTLIVMVASLLAQTQGPGSVQATGTGTISVPPDQAQLTAGVITQGLTAQDAAQQNSEKTAAMLTALKSVLGTSGTIQTVGDSVSPRYNNSQTPTVIGYTASNTVQVTTINLNLVGSLIDAANGAGANNVSGINFSLQDPDPVLQQALGKAAKQALAHTSAIAQGLGAKTGSVISAQEGSRVTPVFGDVGAAAAATPVQTGTVSVSATVTVTVQLVQ